MQRRFLFSIAAFGLALVIPVWAADDKAKADPKDKAAEKMVTAGQVTGSLKVDGGSQKYITVSVNLSYVVPNPQGALQALQRQQLLMQYQQQVMAARSPQQRQVALVQLYRAMAQGQQNLVHVQQMNKDLEFQAADDMKVRVMYPPPAFDEKGNLKKYTAKDLRELKGTDSTLPGYTAEMDALKSGQIVTVYLAKQPPKKKKDKDDLEDDRPSIKMIVIQAEPREKG